MPFAFLRCSFTSRALVISTLALAAHATAAPAEQPTAFTYQGVLKHSGAPLNGSVDLQFRLFDSAAAGNPVGSPIIIAPVAVADGLVQQTLDFGAIAFNGQERWLEIGVSPANGGSGPFTTLTPRQRIASAPYAAFALNAALSGTYGNALNLANPANTVAGSFTGSGAGLTNLNPASLSAGTAGISITGDAANVTGTVAIANGGTGATSASAARANLGVAAASHTHAAGDIASGSLAAARLPTGGTWSLTSNLEIGSTALFIEQATAEVGIGTSSPGAPLEIARNVSSNINPSLILRQGGTSSASAIRYMNSAGNHFNLGITPGNEFALGYNSNISLASDLLRIAANGNVGIGGTSPEARLHVNLAETGNPVVLSGAPLMLESMADNWISMMTDSADLSGIAFGRPGATMAEVVHGGIVYNDTLAGGMEFRTGGNVTHMEIASNGDANWRDASGALAMSLDVDAIVNTPDLRLYSADGSQTRIRLAGQGSSVTGGRAEITNATGAVTAELDGGITGAKIDVGDGSTDTIQLTGNTGIVKANDYQFNAPQTRAYSIRGNCFVPTSNLAQYVSAPNLRASGGTQVSFNAPVQLPQGARITGLELVAEDNAMQNISLSLDRIDNAGGGTGISGAFLTSSGNLAGARTFASGALNSTVDNNTYTYSLSMFWDVPSPTNAITIYKARVLFEVTSVTN